MEVERYSAQTHVLKCNNELVSILNLVWDDLLTKVVLKVSF